MKRPILKFSMTVPLSFLLALLLIVSFSSCSKPNLGDIVKEHFEAVNNGDVEKDLTFFTDDIVFELGVDRKLIGKDQLRNLMEKDAVINVRLTVIDIKVDGSTVAVKEIETNEVCRLVGIKELSGGSIYKFRGRLIEKVKLEPPPEAEEKLVDATYKPFAEWANKEHPQEFSKIEEDLPSAENARLHLSLLKEWRDKTSAEGVSVEQELIRLENEWANAWAKADVAFFERIEADDYTWTSASGEVWTKPRDLAFVKSIKPGKGGYSQVVAEMKVRVYGDAAVVTGRDVIKEMHEGKEISRQERWTDTWVKREGHWQCVAGHSSEIVQK